MSDFSQLAMKYLGKKLWIINKEINVDMLDFSGINEDTAVVAASSISEGFSESDISTYFLFIHIGKLS